MEGLVTCYFYNIFIPLYVSRGESVDWFSVRHIPGKLLFTWQLREKNLSYLQEVKIKLEEAPFLRNMLYAT